MIKKVTVSCILITFILILFGCGELRYCQLAPEAKNFHPRRIAVFPMEVWNHKEADSRKVVEQIVAGSLVERKLFDNVADVESMEKRIQENEELHKVKDEYFSKLKALAFSDPDLSRKMGELAQIDAFLLLSVDEWKYAGEGDNKTAQVGLSMEMYDVATGKLMWKAHHSITNDYLLIKPELPKVARDVVSKMIDYMPH